MKEVVAFKCEHCNKISKSQGSMKNHERKCFNNPVSRSCATCKNLVNMAVTPKLIENEKQINSLIFTTACKHCQVYRLCIFLPNLFIIHYSFFIYLCIFVIV